MLSTPRHQALRTVWLSDVHLGSRECRVNLLLDFLRHTRCDVLYLVGDIIDLENLRKSFYWPVEPHRSRCGCCLKKSQEGTRIVYIPGNHDHDLHALAGVKFGNVEIATPRDPHDARRPPPARHARRSVRRRRAPAVARRLARRLRMPAPAHAESLRALAARRARSAVLVARAARQGALPRRAGATSSATRTRRSRPRARRASTASSAATSIAPRSPRSTACSTATTATGSRAARRSSRISAASCRCSSGGRRPRRSPRPRCRSLRGPGRSRASTPSRKPLNNQCGRNQRSSYFHDFDEQPRGAVRNGSTQVNSDRDQQAHLPRNRKSVRPQ